MLINDHPRCGRCKYWKAMRCINPESKMYEYQMFQRADGICKLWEDGSGLFDDEDNSECKDGEIMTERETAQSKASLYRRAMLGNVYRHFKGATYAYKLVREMNEELKQKGFLTIPGRVSRRYFEEKFYGLRENQ